MFFEFASCQHYSIFKFRFTAHLKPVPPLGGIRLRTRCTNYRIALRFYPKLPTMSTLKIAAIRLNFKLEVLNLKLSTNL
jgi:hypothetical protein